MHAGYGELPAECGGAVRPADRHGGAAARALARPHTDPRAQRHQPSQHRDCQGEHAPGRRVHLPGNHTIPYRTVMPKMLRISRPVFLIFGSEYREAVMDFNLALEIEERTKMVNCLFI